MKWLALAIMWRGEKKTTFNHSIWATICLMMFVYLKLRVLSQNIKKLCMSFHTNISTHGKLSKHRGLQIHDQGPAVKSKYGIVLKVLWLQALPNCVLIHNMKRERMKPHWEMQRVFFTPERIKVLPHCGRPEKRSLPCLLSAALEQTHITLMCAKTETCKILSLFPFI